METKQCTACKEYKTLDNFSMNRRAKDGLTYWCRQCRSIKNRDRPKPTVVPVLFKPCFECGEVKPASSYGVDNKSKDGLQRRCKPCKNANSKAYYQTETGRELNLRVRRRNYVASARAVWDHLSTHPCVDCGESDPIVLEFDHVRGEKHFNLGARGQRTVKQVLAEIEKCDVRCSNCHKRATAARGGWYRWLDEAIDEPNPPLWGIGKAGEEPAA